MKKIYLKAYTNFNLGDDLFLKIISDRYKNEFVMFSYNKYKSINDNLKINKINKLMFRIFQKIANSTNTLSYYENKYLKMSDLVVVVGGSIFMEESNNSQREIIRFYNNCNRPYYIIGSNFGPFKTQEFKNECENKIFNRAEDVSFRDSKSVDLFNNSKIRFSPDMVFSLDVSNIINNFEKRAIISVIDCKKKSSQIGFDCSEEYFKKINELIDVLIDKGYKITLMSFCKDEGDEEVISSILTKRNNTQKIDVYNYTGNIQEALQVLSFSEIIVGSRFHANIIGLLLNKTIIPISYNVKTENLLKDINFKGIKINLKEISDFEATSINDSDLTYKCDISNFKKSSLDNFKILDKTLFLKKG